MTTIGPALEGSPTLFSVAFDLGTVGYSVHEHFVSGSARAYTDARPRTPDGHWEVEPAGTADFTTRIAVYRPTDGARSNGTVIFEWLNVTGGLDIPALWMPTHRHLVREGYTWVGVSAQQVGIEGGGVMPGLGLRDTNPDRYQALSHPGDAYSFDIFTEVGRAVRRELPNRYGLRVDRLLATGASQSAFHLTTYVNAIDPRDAAFDGFLLQGRAGAGVPIESWGPDAIGPTLPTEEVRRVRLRGRDRIRDDTRVPVMVVQSETDIFGAIAYLGARQPDSERFRLWEVAGAAHSDTYFLVASPRDTGELPATELAELIARSSGTGLRTKVPINCGPQMHYVLQRAFDALDQWARGGDAPPTADRLAVGDDGMIGVDDFGIARGGVRTPWVDVPTNVLSGLGQPGYMTELFGTSRPLDATALASLYPRGRDDYLDRFGEATRAAVDRGFLLATDAPEIEAIGAASWTDELNPS